MADQTIPPHKTHFFKRSKSANPYPKMPRLRPEGSFASEQTPSKAIAATGRRLNLSAVPLARPQVSVYFESDPLRRRVWSRSKPENLFRDDFIA